VQSPELGRRFAIQWRRRKSRCGCERFRPKTLGSKSHRFYFSHGSILIGVDDDHNPKVTVKNLLGVLFLEVWAIDLCRQQSGRKKISQIEQKDSIHTQCFEEFGIRSIYQFSFSWCSNFCCSFVEITFAVAVLWNNWESARNQDLIWSMLQSSVLPCKNFMLHLNLRTCSIQLN
jgi:hypothetical protein